MPPISLYIPSYNVAAHLERCLRGVLAQTLRPAEIIVVDDGSTDATAEIAARFPEVRYVRHAVNSGLGATRNTGVAEARHELVASLDADTSPDPTWLERLVQNLDDPQVGGAGGMLVERTLHSSADRWRKLFMSQNWGRRPRRNPRFMFGSNTIVRKSLVQSLGGYDPKHRTNGEDMDLSAKLRKAGYDTVYDPTAVVGHYRTDTNQSIFDTRWRWLYNGYLVCPRIDGFWRLTALVLTAIGLSLWELPRALLSGDAGVLALNLRFPWYFHGRARQAWLTGRRQRRELATARPPASASRSARTIEASAAKSCVHSPD